jgi:signal transduction histidine kinase
LTNHATTEPPPSRILIVDDEAANLTALRVTLGHHGYETEGFTDPTAALAALKQGGFDLLLTDLRMPGMGGVELLQRAQALDPNLVGVIMTGEGSIASAVEAMKTGALDYILKPLKLGAILPVLSRALTMRRLRLENAALEHSVRERTAERERALREVENQTTERLRAEQAMMQIQKMEALGQLTGGVAHDFNNLLMAIDGALHLLDKRLEPDHVGRKYIEGAREATRRGARVTNQLLAFSRTQRIELQPIDACAALREAAPIIAHALGPTISLRLDFAPGEIWTKTHRDQLELAVVNLAVNARDAMPDGGEVVLGVAPGDGPAAVIWLRDGGCGMTPETATRALEPFFTTKERGKGTGLGLTQVYGFAHQCKGEVSIESAPGEGATVRIVLPRIEAPAAEVKERPADISVARGGRVDPGRIKVLVVDDDDAVRQVLVDGLRFEGFDVIEAAGGVDGLAALQSRSPDALVVDFAMPGMNGAEVGGRARALRPGLPIVFCSGYSDTAQLEKVEGAVLLRKPVSIGVLGRAVMDLVAAQTV